MIFFYFLLLPSSKFQILYLEYIFAFILKSNIKTATEGFLKIITHERFFFIYKKLLRLLIKSVNNSNQSSVYLMSKIIVPTIQIEIKTLCLNVKIICTVTLVT